MLEQKRRNLVCLILSNVHKLASITFKRFLKLQISFPVLWSVDRYLTVMLFSDTRISVKNIFQYQLQNCVVSRVLI